MNRGEAEGFGESEARAWGAERIQTSEFDPGSGRTLAACLTHASRTGIIGRKASAGRLMILVADG